MNFLINELNKRIKFYQDSKDIQNLLKFQQVRIEFLLVFLLGYLYNKNYHNLEISKKEYIIRNLSSPGIQTFIHMCNILDEKKEIINGITHTTLEEYRGLRNDYLGHGYILPEGEEQNKNIIDKLNQIYELLINSLSIFNGSIIHIKNINGYNYEGVSYSVDGSCTKWILEKNKITFEIGEVYILHNITYSKLSPFFIIRGSNFTPQIFMFSKVKEVISGKAEYNNILETGKEYLESIDFKDFDIDSDEYKRQTKNKTIINNFELNYKDYIETSIKDNIEKFLLENKSSVSATIWGHGGVGKTATIQSICNDLSLTDNKKFDYIIFLSAKDREYNYHTGDIVELENYSNKVENYEDIVRFLNKILFNKDNSLDIDDILNIKEKVLLIFDDFETFLKDDQELIKEFILKLNINYHKVIITTRANIVIGYEIKNNELSKNDTINFLMIILKNNNSIEQYHEGIIQEENKQKIYNITSGRPIFIFQLAHLFGQIGFDKALNYDIKSSKKSIEFLYGRIFDYLNENTKKIFVIIGQLVTKDDLSNMIQKIEYILDNQNIGESIKELEKLKIIEVKEGFFTVYSEEIINIMHEYFLKQDKSFKDKILSKLKEITRDIKLDNDELLLKNANLKRITGNEAEVVSNYKQILNRISSSEKIKLQALSNLADYLFNDRGNKDYAIEILNEYFHIFKGEAVYIKRLATYLWAGGHYEQRKKSIEILSEYFQGQDKFSSDINIELFGLYILYTSLSIINEKDELKGHFYRNEISNDIFYQKSNSIKKQLHRIDNEMGKSIMKYIKENEVNNLPSGAKQNLATGLFQYLEILNRLGEYDKGIEICDYVIKNFPNHYMKIFNNKRNKLLLYKRQKLKNYYNKNK